LERFEIYKCKIKLRPTYKGRPLKEKVKQLDGKIFELECMWQCEEDENYPGEYAMGPRDNKKAREAFMKADIGWMASGDMEILDA
jgi:hypothetical protein